MERLSELITGQRPRKSDFEKVCEQLIKLHEKKNADYSGTKGESVAEEMFKRYGDQYFVMMIHQKAARIERVAGAEHRNYESLEDSYRDIANYAIMALLAHQNEY